MRKQQHDIDAGLDAQQQNPFARQDWFSWQALRQFHRKHAVEEKQLHFPKTFCGRVDKWSRSVPSDEPCRVALV